MQPLAAPLKRRTLPAFATAPVLLLVLAKLAVHVAVIERYGWQRDELYYRAAGRHLGLGYVDFPPVTPLLAALDHALFGDSLGALRAFAVVAGCVSVVLCALIARELGGGRLAQVVAAAAAAASPLLLATNGLFQPVSFDQLMWGVVLLLVVRLLRTGDVRLWPLIGLAAGVGLETKYTMIVLLAGLGLGLLASRRELVSRRGALVAAAIAFVVMVPNLWWQIRHGWASVDFFVHPGASATDESRPGFIGNFLLLGGPVALPLWVAGVVTLWRDRDRRALAIAAAFVIAAFFVLGGKSYYAAPIFLLLFAAGGVAFERWAAGRRRLVPALAIVLLLVGPGPELARVLPVQSERQLVKSGLWDDRSDYGDEIGWPELTDGVAHVFGTLPPAVRAHAAVLTENYGEAGAVDLFGPARGLPGAASGHMTYSYWRPPRADATTVVSVGYSVADARRYCSAVREVGKVSNHLGIYNEEFGAPILVCRLRQPLSKVLPHLRHFR